MKHFKLRPDLSTEHYDLDLERTITLYRIEALMDIPKQEVKKGDIGGFVESEDNLYDNAWVRDYAKVFGNARVGGDAQVFRYAQVYGDARVFGNAEVYGTAQVCGDAKVYGNARVFRDALVCGYATVSGGAKVFDNANVYGNALVLGDAEVCGDAQVGGDAEVSAMARVPTGFIQHESDWVNILGGRYTITILPNHIQIGCQCHTREEWWNFTDKEILEMDGKEGLKWWKTWKPKLQSLCS